VKLQVTFETGHPARLDGLDGVVSPIYSDERPLKGVAGHVDWRLNGFISRLVMDDRLIGDSGEWLLVHTQGRLPYTHLFLVGMGAKDARSSEGVKTVLSDVASKVALAGLHAFGINLDEVAGVTMPAEEAMVFFLESLSGAYPEDDLSNPPYRPALEAQQRNEERQAKARARREQLVAERAAWDEEAANRDATSLAEGEAAVAGDDDSLSHDDGPFPGEETDSVRKARPRAGEVPPAVASDVPAPPPDPSSVDEPELEEEPERTVRVTLLGDQQRLAAMRQALRDWRTAGDGQLDVEWSR
jgi:hypothetical protein